ncbi:MAG: hypothetical protein GY726_01265 [Proteobacteria bacterium]|nr:hypothetical protein [Pseudomonadota bacterium]
MSPAKPVVSPSRAQCICSTRGFEHPAWNAQYYPGNCPEEWRLAYFMNDFRALYLPGNTWNESEAQLDTIADELDEGFELVIEWPSPDDVQDIEATLSHLAPLRQNISCVVVDVDGVSEPVLEATYQAIARDYFINFRSSMLGADVQETFARQHEAGFVWYPDQLEAPVIAAQYQVVCLPCQSLRDMKSVLARLRPFLLQEARAGLFLEPAAQSVFRALEVRTLIELMGLA